MKKPLIQMLFTKPLMRIALYAVCRHECLQGTGMPPPGMLAFKSKSLTHHNFLCIEIEAPQQKARKESMQRQVLHQLRKGVFGFDHSVNPLVLLPGVRCSSSTHSDDGHFEEKKHSDDGLLPGYYDITLHQEDIFVREHD
ncbi:uncharacterized protein LOC124651055 isoform X2 [Lolium rigidum]|uniref:uncharacterized protein LOC124651055 isoform X2 n=1 Tax=Lolium rigidum TaxID=89674 RepID=UPI001F5E0817|nr:uncharacterized protein LOC124651055 isoform X2 [Lolium rigidum]